MPKNLLVKLDDLYFDTLWIYSDCKVVNADILLLLWHLLLLSFSLRTLPGARFSHHSVSTGCIGSLLIFGLLAFLR